MGDVSTALLFMLENVGQAWCMWGFKKVSNVYRGQI